MNPAVQMLKRAGGIARMSDLTAAGITRGHIRSAVSAQQIRRISRGVYGLPELDPVLAAIHASKAQPACITAAQLNQLWVLSPPSRPHVSVDHGRALHDFEVHRHAGKLSLLDAVVQCMRCLPELDALVIAESAVVLRRLSLLQLRRRLSGRSDAKLRSICDQINPHSESIIETVARYHLRKAGLTVQVQVRFSKVGRIDLFIDGVLGLEVDGAGFHSTRKAYREDRRRWNLVTRAGVPLLRVTYEMVVHEPNEFMALVRETLKNVR